MLDHDWRNRIHSTELLELINGNNIKIYFKKHLKKLIKLGLRLFTFKKSFD